MTIKISSFRIKKFQVFTKDYQIVIFTEEHLLKTVEKKNTNLRMCERIFTKEMQKIIYETKGQKGDFNMSTINITNARKDLYNLVENANLYHEPTLIVGKKGNAVLISEEDWSAIQETLYLNSIDGMAESILEGAKTPIENCVSEDMVNW